jgi:alkaline phosphatase D
VPPARVPRRTLLRAAAGGVAGAVSLGAAGLVRSDRPRLTHGVQSGDVLPGSGIVWTRADRPSRMLVEVADRPDFRGAVRLPGPLLTPDTDLTGRLRVPGRGRVVHYRVSAEDLDGRTTSAPVTGSFRLPPGPDEGVRFLWSGDVVGQGFGINPDAGGMRVFAAMAARDPDFFLCSGDTVYADGTLDETVLLPDGRTWRNLVTPAKTKPAETLDEYRGAFAYNRLDEHLRAFTAAVAQINQWDDHEVHDNWFPGQVLTDDRYTERRVDVLAERAYRAFHEWVPVDRTRAVDGRVFRRLPHGPHLEVFVIDMRAHRDPNGPNTGPAGALLGERQARWLADGLADSTATWKVVAADLPLGRVVGDAAGGWDSVSNGVGGPPLGRETELARLLGALRDRRVRNVVWLAADVHYTSAHHYSPDRAAFDGFDPFWEFVSGPLNAGAFGPAALDPTFGPEAVFVHAPSTPGSSPLDGFQHFGEVEVAPGGRELTVTLRDQYGTGLWSRALSAE